MHALGPLPDSEAPPVARPEIGDPAPPFALGDQSGERIDLADDSRAGRPTLLLFLADPEAEGTRTALGGVQAALPAIRSTGAQVVALTTGLADQVKALAGDLGLDFPLLADLSGEVFERYGLVGADGVLDPELAACLVVRGNGHLMARIEGADEESREQVLAHLRAEASLRATRTMSHHPPILLVPDVLSREDCQRLIGTFLMEGNVWVEPGHGDKGMTSDYKMRIPEYGRRDRVDHWVINAKTRDFISKRLKERLFPEIEKAFHYKITKAETYRIGCYEGERGGELHGHRDNSSAMGAHRRFACSINLNSEEFEGGAIRFPEFGDQRYRPDTGVAFTFSSSLLHEPLPVTAGRRFVLLAFLFGDS
ncbi:MAG: redoxin domain-containing protein [Pseudomonadota bacterium]